MKMENHPCFNDSSRHSFGRLHLPVAPACNMQCNYCRRDFECVNESRPGVAGKILKPAQAMVYLDAALEKMKNISVVGIAGPGDPLANGAETMETLRMVREKYPDMLLCVATNGLELPPYAEELARLKISHMTVTVNALDADIGAKIYAWARYNRKMYRGVDAARIIAQNQKEGILKLKALGVTVKVNTVVIPGINDAHVIEIARTMKKIGVDIMNCIPMYQIEGTAFEKIAPPEPSVIHELRREAGVYIPQMAHCARCRADAAGLIGQSLDGGISKLLDDASKYTQAEKRPYVAVASREGLFVNQHLGEARILWIYGRGKDGGVCLIDKRKTPPSGAGDRRWADMADLLKDCGTVLAEGVGPNPLSVLESTGLRVLTMEGMIAEGVGAIIKGEEVPKMLLRTAGRCGLGKACQGTGMGCG